MTKIKKKTALAYAEKKIIESKNIPPHEFKNLVEEYFLTCDDENSSKWSKDQVSNGKKVTIKQKRPYTLIGLASHLELTIKSLLLYAKKKEYAEVMLHAFMKIQTDLTEGTLLNQYNYMMGSRLMEAMHIASLALGFEENENDDQLMNLPSDQLAIVLQKKAEIKAIQANANNILDVEKVNAEPFLETKDRYQDYEDRRYDEIKTDLDPIEIKEVKSERGYKENTTFTTPEYDQEREERMKRKNITPDREKQSLERLEARREMLREKELKANQEYLKNKKN